MRALPSKDVNEISLLIYIIYFVCRVCVDDKCLLPLLQYRPLLDDMWILLKNSQLFSEERCFMTFA